MSRRLPKPDDRQPLPTAHRGYPDARAALHRAAAVALMRLSPLSSLPPHMADLTDLGWRREPYPPARPRRHKTADAAPAVTRAVAPRATAGPPPGKQRCPPSPVRPRAMRLRLRHLALCDGPSNMRGGRPAPVATVTRCRPRSARASPRPTPGPAASRQRPNQPPWQRSLPRSLPRTQKLRPPPPPRAAGAEGGGDAMAVDDDDEGASAAAPRPGQALRAIAIQDRKRKGPPNPTLEDVRNAAAGVGGAVVPPGANAPDAKRAPDRARDISRVLRARPRWISGNDEFEAVRIYRTPPADGEAPDFPIPSPLGAPEELLAPPTAGATIQDSQPTD